MDNKIICKCGRKMSIYHLHKHINTKSHNNKCLLIYLNNTKKYIDDIEIMLNDIEIYLKENKEIWIINKDFPCYEFSNKGNVRSSKNQQTIRIHNFDNKKIKDKLYKLKQHNTTYHYYKIYNDFTYKKVYPYQNNKI